MPSISAVKTIAIALCAVTIATPSYAQSMFEGLKERAKKEVAKELANNSSKPDSSTPEKSAQPAATSTQALGSPPKSLTSLTKCAGLELSNIMIGEYGKYTFQQGFSNEERSGFIRRRSGKTSDGCILPSLNPQEYAYIEVDTKAYEAMGSSNDWEMQCLYSEQPNKGAIGNSEPKGEYPYKADYLAGKDVLLHCGNSEGLSECAEGSNSSRSGAWKKKLESRGKTMLSVLAVQSTLAPSNGQKLYCQYYNKKSGTSLFAFEYLRKRG